MANPNKVDVAVMRSMLSRARGLGAAKSGTAHWWGQRVTALALIPLAVWFVATIIQLSHQPRAAVALWMASPIHAALLLALLAAMFHHMQLGLAVVIEDYVRANRTRVGSLLLVKALTALLFLASAISVVRLAVAG